jgi:Flp pilus assembly pilin Flp
MRIFTMKRSRKGASLIEYAMMVGLISAGLIITVVTFSDKVVSIFTTAESSISDASAGASPDTSGPWEVLSEDLGQAPGGMVITVAAPNSVNLLLVSDPGGGVVRYPDGSTDTIPPNTAVSTSKFVGGTGDKDIFIEGDIWLFRDDGKTIKYVKSFGSIGLASLNYGFASGSILERVAPIPATVTNITYMFLNYTGANPDGIQDWDVSNVTSMQTAFDGASSLTLDLTPWCVSHISARPTNFGLPNGIEPIWGSCPP